MAQREASRRTHRTPIRGWEGAAGAGERQLGAHLHSRLSRLIWSATTLSCSWYSDATELLISLELPFRAAISIT